MNKQEWCRFVHDSYKAEHEAAESIYRRAGVLLTAMTVLSGLVAALTRLELLDRLFVRIDVSLYYFFLLGTYASIAFAAAFLLMTLIHRPYGTIAPVKDWQEFRKNANEESLTEALTKMLEDAHKQNVGYNRARLQHMGRAVYSICFATAGSFVALFMFAALRVQGV